MSLWSALGWAALMVGVLLPPRVAAAGGGVVLQSYGGDVPEDAAYLMAPFLDELSQLGFVAKVEDVSALLEQRLSEPPRYLGKADVDRVRKEIEAAYQAWLTLELERAIEGGGVAVDRLLANAETMTRDASMRESLMRGLVTVALASGRLDEPERAIEAMKTARRYFPERDVSRVQYGPEAWKHYRAAIEALGEPGVLDIEIGPGETAGIFVNGRYVSTTGPVRQHLVAGRYRVFIQLAGGRGRVHVVEVDAGKTVRLEVDPFLDSVLETDDFGGLLFPDEVLRAGHEARLARAVGARLGVERVITVGVRKHEGELAVVASALGTAEGEVLRTVVLRLGRTPAAADLRRLARKLALGSEKGAGATDAAEPVVTLEATGTEGGLGGDPWPWMAVGGGVAALATGATLIAIDGNCVDQTEPACRDLRNTRLPGIAASAVGAGLIGLGIYLWLEDDEPAGGSLAVLPTVGGGALAIRGRF